MLFQPQTRPENVKSQMFKSFYLGLEKDTDLREVGEDVNTATKNEIGQSCATGQVVCSIPVVCLYISPESAFFNRKILSSIYQAQ